MLNIVLEVGWGYGQRGSARTCEVKQVKNRIRGRGRVIGHRSGVKGQGHTQGQGRGRGRIRIRIKSQRSGLGSGTGARSGAGTGAIGRGQE